MVNVVSETAGFTSALAAAAAAGGAPAEPEASPAALYASAADMLFFILFYFILFTTCMNTYAFAEYVIKIAQHTLPNMNESIRKETTVCNSATLGRTNA